MTRVRTVVSTTTVTCRHLISRKNAHISTRFERHDRAAMGSIIGKITEELPRHEVLTKTASYEIRRYAPCVVAETGFQSKKGMFEGDMGEGELEIGQIAALIREIKPAKAIIDEIIAEYEQAKNELVNSRW